MSAKATLAIGPFSRAAPFFRHLTGIEQVTCGYTGGVTDTPSAVDVATGRTGHVEALEISFAPDDITFATLLQKFWSLHDPTAMSFTSAEDGAHYRSAIFYHDAAQAKAARASLAAAQRRFMRPILTLIEPARAFWPAHKVRMAPPADGKAGQPSGRVF